MKTKKGSESRELYRKLVKQWISLIVCVGLLVCLILFSIGRSSFFKEKNDTQTATEQTTEAEIDTETIESEESK